jgi:hypothetical protein
VIVLGIDPGASGGLAIVQGGHGIYSVSDAVKMPATDADLWRFVNDCADADLCILEKVHAMPGQGVSSTFKFGASWGTLRMAVIAAGIPLEEVTPRKWQPAIGVPSKKGETKTQHKNRLKARAQELFPGLKITHATADALLLAVYGLRTFGERGGV